MAWKQLAISRKIIKLNNAADEINPNNQNLFIRLKQVLVLE